MIIGLVSLVKTQVAALTANVFPIPAPPLAMSQYPVITYQVASHAAAYTFTGPDGVTTERVVFDCLAPSYKEARELAETLARALSGYAGTLSDGTQIFETRLANILDRWDDGSKVSCTSIHALITYSD